MVAFTVLASLVLHGVTATPIMSRLDRLRDRTGDAETEPAARHL